MPNHYRNFTTVLTMLFVFSTTSALYSQGLTTAGMKGIVTDDKGEALEGANVVAVHDPSGTRYGAAVRDGGFFDIQNMKIGGPYTLSVSFVGFRSFEQKDIFPQSRSNRRF